MLFIQYGLAAPLRRQVEIVVFRIFGECLEKGFFLSVFDDLRQRTIRRPNRSTEQAGHHVLGGPVRSGINPEIVFIGVAYRACHGSSPL
jgi:hypothetical protein